MIIFVKNSYQIEQEVVNLPPSAKFVLYLLQTKGVLNRQEIIQHSLLPKRTAAMGLKALIDHGMATKIQGDELKKMDRHYRTRIDYRHVYYKSIIPNFFNDG